MALPTEYTAALLPLAEAFSHYEQATGHSAVLVGGAAAAIHTDGAFMSADFDVVAFNDDAFAHAMTSAGFVEDDKALHGLTGWYHPDHPDLAVEQVSGQYFDGFGDKARCLRLAFRDNAVLVLPAIEDLIADRLGQHEVSSGNSLMLDQARALYLIAGDLDQQYLIERIVEESGNPALLGLSSP